MSPTPDRGELYTGPLHPTGSRWGAACWSVTGASTNLTLRTCPDQKQVLVLHVPLWGRKSAVYVAVACPGCYLDKVFWSGPSECQHTFTFSARECVSFRIRSGRPEIWWRERQHGKMQDLELGHSVAPNGKQGMLIILCSSILSRQRIICVFCFAFEPIRLLPFPNTIISSYIKHIF